MVTGLCGPLCLILLLFFLQACILGSGALAVTRKSSGLDNLRLVGGGSRCRGRLQVQSSGQNWTEVNPERVPLWFGHRLCADLDCGSALSVEQKRVSRREAVSLFPYDCENAPLIDCFTSDRDLSDSSLELNCSDSVRLVSGRTSCSGSLQIRDQSLNQTWTPVCEGAVGRQATKVLCRELGCGPPLLQGALSPLGQMFQCQGNEAALMDCPRNQTRTDPGTCSGPSLNLRCSEPLRLVGGASRCEGTVEVEHRGEWRRVVTYGSWDLGAVAAVCRALGCGSAVSTEQRRGLNISDVEYVWSDCVKKMSSVRDCVESGSSDDDQGLEVVCSDSVRLVSGRTSCSGSLQIRDQSLDQTWTPVCEGAVDHRATEVLCRELRCGPPLLQGALSPLGQMFQCQGNESALMNCPRDQTRTDPGTCSGPSLNLSCSEPLRLVGGASRCEGTVEVEHRGEWRRVWTSGFWDLGAAAAVCRALGCGSVLSTEIRWDLNISAVWVVRSDCVKETSVRDCVYDGSYRVGLEVLCSDSVRLVSGQTSCSGSLQIRDQSLNQTWTPVCEGAVDHWATEVLCRELRCGPPLLQGALSPLGQMFQCQGNEAALMNCPRDQTRTDPGTCSGPSLNLSCSEPLRLVGGASRCEGTVEAELRGEWRRVVTYGSSGFWDPEIAAAVCRGLGCGSAVSTEKRQDLNISDLWVVDPVCVKKTSVRDCLENRSARPHGLEVLCSELLDVPEVSVSEGAPRAQGRVRVMMGADFWVKCSVKPQYPGAGSFQLLSPTTNLTLPAVNYSAHFLFNETGPAHRGDYTCVYLQEVYNHTFSSRRTLHIHPEEPYSLRLVGGGNRCWGHLQVQRSGQTWTEVDPILVPLWFGHRLCADLDCGSALSVEQKSVSEREAVYLDPDHCGNAPLIDCFTSDKRLSVSSLELSCSDSVRLVSGRTSCSGSLQIRDQSLDQTWTSVCEGAVDHQGTKVLCRELGCGPPLLQGALSPLGQMFQCQGNEAALMNCPRDQTRTDPGTCSGPSLNLRCSEPLRLVGGASRCEGTLEAELRGEWRRLWTYGSWDLGAAAAVCRALGCGSAVSTKDRWDLNISDVWVVRSDCVKKTSSVRDCFFGGYSDDDQGLEVVCSGKV